MQTKTFKIEIQVCRIIALVILMTASLFSAYSKQPLTLEECRKMALEKNRQVGIAINELNRAEAAKQSARTNYLPKISFAGGWIYSGNNVKLLDNDLFIPIVPYNTIDPATGAFNHKALSDPTTALNTLVIDPATGQPVTDPFGNPIFKNYALIPSDNSEIDKRNLYYARINVTQPIFTGFKIVEANNMANRAAAIVGEQVKLTKAEVISKADAAYWLVVSLQEKVKLANSYETLLDKLVADLENVYAEGMITRNDLLKAKVKQNDAKLNVMKAENGLSISKMALAQIIGMEGEAIYVAENAIYETLPLPSRTLMENASPENRAEISMLKEKIHILESQKNIVRSKFMPNVMLNGGYDFMNPNPYKGFKNEFGGNWNVGIAVTVPIFTWGERNSDLSAANYEVQKAQMELDDTRDKINLQISRDQFRYTESLKKVELTKLSKDQAEENLRLAQNQLSEGRSKLTDLLEAQIQWESASSEYIDALIEVRTTLSDLEKSTGEMYQYIFESENSK